MKKWEQLKGETFNSLTLVGVRKVGNKYPGVFKCICGNETLKDLHKVRTGIIQSCGCKMADNISKSKTKHGHSRSRNQDESSEYVSWRAMKDRCLNPNSSSYQNYGGRKIKVCKRWQVSFDDFLADMGKKPTREHTIERRNTEWGYVPTNCYWATRAVQSRNQRQQDSVSGIQGVQQVGNRWLAAITVDYRRLHLGSFSSAEEAQEAYHLAKKKFHTI